MYKILFLIALLIVAPVSAIEGSQLNVTIGGGGGAFITHGDHYSEASGASLGFITGNENYQYQAAGTHIVTLGGTSYAETDKYDNRIKNTVNVKNELIYDSQAVVDNTYALVDNRAYIPDMECTAGNLPTAGSNVGPNGTLIVEGQTPSYQSVEVHYDGAMAGGGKYRTNGVIDDSNLTSSMRAVSYGDAGSVTANYAVTAEAGYNSSNNDVNFRKQDYGHTTWIARDNMTYEAEFDLEYKDYSKALQASEETSNSSIVVGNETIAFGNETVTNATVTNTT